MSFLKNNNWHRILISVILLFSLHTVAQKDQNLKNLLDATNSFYGSNDLLTHGEIYQAEHLYAKGHPYFVTDEYTLASVKVNNETFDNVKARYNIALDQLIIRARVDSGSLVTMITNGDWVSSFAINEHVFINVNELYHGKELDGYCEQINNGDKILYIKYKKKFINSYDNNTPRGFYTKLLVNKYIYTSGIFILVNKRKNFYKVYGDKKNIKEYLRTNNINYSEASCDQLKMLMQFCNGLPK